MPRDCQPRGTRASRPSGPAWGPTPGSDHRCTASVLSDCSGSLIDTRPRSSSLSSRSLQRATYEAIDNNVNHCLLSIETLERKFRSPHAILFGVAESLGEKHLAEVKTLLGAPSIYETIRLGKHSPTAPRPRPVLIKFTSVAAKHAAYKKAKDLRRQFNVSMDDDLTPQQKAARMRRQPEVHTLRGEGWITFWRGDQLFKVKAGGAPLKVPVGAPAAPAHAAPTAAPAPTSSPAAGLTPSTSSGAAGPSPMCA
eukprot:jgi/Botrbrau1/6596/Bobra.0189s0023.1